ncbi:methyltransferase domain-containing protein [Ephemerocybe angulata]|uniref:Methyltransferase domain-containing protein n=1 Tax=Ephemerocybe angulata TaxID=980116 RepID=A0A8H6I559_9AGAR|nr:methyltransferase domain-containing protein [Tulosesus angulatus]
MMSSDSPTNDVLRLRHLAVLLANHRSLLTTHPNDCNLTVISDEWSVSSEDLTRYYAAGVGGDYLPKDLRSLIDNIRALQIPREPTRMPNLRPLPTTKGMSPKKLHEVHRMANYVKDVVDSINDSRGGAHRLEEQLHIVDVGAGQGYLTRALGALFPRARLLALDADHGQTEGAERRGKLPERRIDTFTAEINDRIDHKTMLVTPDSLLQAVDDWIGQPSPSDPQPRPRVLFVALHACGSLTPDMLKAFLSSVTDSNLACAWDPLAIVAVGCCYNLMYPGDYPLSHAVRSYMPATEYPLPTSAYHLAAQIPLTWLHEDVKAGKSTLRPSVQLATRKIVWRALLGTLLSKSHDSTPLYRRREKDSEVKEEGKKVLNSSDVPVKWWVQPRSEPGTENADTSPPQPTFDRLIQAKTSDYATQPQGIGITEAGLRLGKLPDSAYTNGWQHFLNIAGQRLGIRWEVEDVKDLRDPVLEKQVESLHTLRCFLGSAIESAILLDRLQWLREELSIWEGLSERDGGKDTAWDVELVNLFDQAVGSGRNIGVVIAPVIPSYG